MRLNIAYASGDGYAKHAGVSMISLFENNKDFNEIFIYYIDNGLLEETKQKLNSITKKYNRNIVFIPISDIFDVKSFKENNYYSNIIYTKMYFHKLKGVDKILYIDSDMVIKGSFLELWNMDISNYLMAGVRMPTPIQYRNWFSNSNDDKYINVGFVLFNLVKWRIYEMDKKIIEFLEKNTGREFIEENIMCNICGNKILILDPRYNLTGIMLAFSSDQIKQLTKDETYYNEFQLDNARKNPIVIHYSNEIYDRPWFKKCNHPYKNEYLEYLTISPWDGELENGVISLKVKIRNILRKILPFPVYYYIRSLQKKRGWN
ncbi:glycosyltransferase family 8 protein [Paenibacillus sp. FSL R10-2199]|uniref:glycosyltransferase family 8 protein n=1 Tax=Paenibacillus sp. FSL R10-2199 TaxID=2975348 RepID=UPI0030FB8DA0